MESYRRLRHTYGFGVHSPYAYTLVKDVVTPGRYAFYGYGEIDDTFGATGMIRRVRREARMLLRLTSFLKARRVFLPSGIHAAYHAAVKGAGRGIEVVRRPQTADSCNLVCSYGDFIPLDRLRAMLATPGVTVALRAPLPRWADALFDALPSGLMLEGNRNLICISRPEMQKVRYTILL